MKETDWSARHNRWSFQEYWRGCYQTIPREKYVEWALDFFGVKEFDECYWLDLCHPEDFDDWYLHLVVDTMICRWDFGDPLPDLIFKVMKYKETLDRSIKTCNK